MTPSSTLPPTIVYPYGYSQSISVESERDYANPEPWSAATTFETAWALTSVNKLNKLRQMPIGWDTYGSIPPTLKAVSTAAKLVARMSLSDRLVAGPTPTVAPVSGGAVHLTIYSGTKEFEVNISPAGSIGLLVSQGADETEYSFPEADDKMLSWLATWMG